MTKIDIVSGFLGAGKTTLIKKLLAEAFPGEKLVLIENEFGEISIDGGFLKESGVEISEMSSGCICCSLVGDFNQALKDVVDQFTPDRVLIEPSGVGKLSDVIAAVESAVAERTDMKLNSFVTVADATKVKIYMKNFGEFYNNQIESAGTIILSRTQKLTQEKLEAAVSLLREKNADVAILTTPWDTLDGKTILSAMEKVSLAEELLEKMHHEHHHHECDDPDCECHHHEHHHHDHECDDPDCECHHHEHHHHDHECDDPDCECHHHEHHHHDHECDDPDCECHHHEHHHHDHECDDPDCECHHHEHHHHDHHHDHHHEHGHDCTCGCHDHDHHHHHHHADEVFTSWGKETPRAFTRDALAHILAELDSGKYGKVLRAKGIVNDGDGKWLEFDFVPEEHEIRAGHPDYTGRLCVIGAELDEQALTALFGL